MRIAKLFRTIYFCGLCIVLGSGCSDSSEPDLSYEIPGLMLNYSFEEQSGNTAQNSAGPQFDATIFAASRVDGQFGGGINFGIDNARMEMYELMSFGDGLITIEMWINPDQIEAGETYRLFGDNNIYELVLQIRDGRLEILFQNQSYHYGSTVIAPNQWTHVAFTSDGVNITTYINGVVDSQTNIILPVRDNIGLIYIGVNRELGVTTLYQFTDQYLGTIDELRVWDIARTEEEIADMMYEQL